MAGFGGQGLMFLGKLTVQTMMDEGMHVTYFPSYGAEVRGGTANCHVIVSSDEIASPVVEMADTLVVMNQPSYERFKTRLSPDGALLANVSLIELTDPPPAEYILEIPATRIATDLGDVRCANMTMMGAYNQMRSFVPIEKLIEQMKRAFGEGKSAIWDLNAKALEVGRDLAREQLAASSQSSTT